MKKTLCLLAGLLTLALTPAVAADNYTITSGGVTRTIRAKECQTGILCQMSIPSDATGVPYGAGSGLYVRQDGAWTFGLTGALPLPAGAATSVLQAAGNAALGAPSDAAWDGSASTATIVSILKGLPRTAGAGGGTASSVTLLPGTAAVGTVGVTALPALPAGANAIGSVTLGAGSAAVGTVGVTALPALPAGSNTIGTVNVGTSGLPTGAASAANQTTANTSLASIDTKTPALVNGAVPVDTIVRQTSVNRGGPLTTANTAVTLVPANSNRRGLAVQNRNAPGSAYSATTSVFMNCLATATADFNSLEIPAGALYETPAHHSGTGACSFISATASTPVYIREF